MKNNQESPTQTPVETPVKTPSPVKWHENVAKQAVSQGVFFDDQGIAVKITK